MSDGQVYPRPRMPLLKVVNFTQAGAVQNTWYTAFQGVNVQFLGFAAGITVADETVEIRVTIDGVALASSAAIACLFATNFLTSLPSTLRDSTGTPFFIQAAASANIDYGGFSATDARNWLKGKSVKIEVRKTTAGGASALLGRGIYFQW